MRHPADDLPEDRPEHEDEEVRDATTIDPFPVDTVNALIEVYAASVGRSVDKLKKVVRKQG